MGERVFFERTKIIFAGKMQTYRPAARRIHPDRSGIARLADIPVMKIGMWHEAEALQPETAAAEIVIGNLIVPVYGINEGMSHAGRNSRFDRGHADDRLPDAVRLQRAVEQSCVDRNALLGCGDGGIVLARRINPSAQMGDFARHVWPGKARAGLADRIAVLRLLTAAKHMPVAEQAQSAVAAIAHEQAERAIRR